MPDPASGSGPTAQVNVGIFNGTRALFPNSTQVLYQLHNNRQWQWQPQNPFGPPLMRWVLPVQGNPMDDTYTVVATVDGWGTCGYMPINLIPASVTIVNLMLIPSPYKFDFTNASWDGLRQNRPRIWNLLSGRIADPAAGNPQAQGIYEALINNADPAQQKKAACLLNILTAMDQIQLHGNLTPLDFLRDMDWNYQMAQDRFYCWADPALIDAIRNAGGLFAKEPNPSAFHGGTADLSWKEAQYGEANVQFTFHSSIKSPKNPNWIRLEPDMDYFKDLGAHFFGEVFVNWFGSLTEPSQVYRMRWTDGSKPGSLPFNPPYVITG